MSWSESYLDGLATDTGFRADTLEKVLRLGEILRILKEAIRAA